MTLIGYTMIGEQAEGEPQEDYPPSVAAAEVVVGRADRTKEGER